MSGNRKNPRAQWHLPDVVNPTEQKCMQIPVPNDRFHIAAFQGALLALSSAYNWANDSAHTAVEAANVWRDIIDALDWGCDAVPVQFRTVDTCFLQASWDAGATWTTIFNAYPCGALAAQDTIQNYQNNNNLPGGGQPPAIGGGTPTQCYDWTVELRGNDQWKIPLTLSPSDTITVTDATGGWTDNLPNVGYWFCPDGQQYVLGACADSQSTESTDPAPTVYHMRLLGHFGTVYTDMYNTTYSVPPGGDVDGYFQANDSNIQDNGGSIKFHVQVCKGGWCAHFDFASSDGGWVADGAGSYGGSAWNTTVEAVWDECYIKRSASSYDLKHVEFKGTSSWSGDPAGAGKFGIYVKHGGTTTKVADVTAPNGPYTITWDGDYPDVTDVWLDANVYNHADYSGSGSATITECVMWGAGSNPYSTYPC